MQADKHVDGALLGRGPAEPPDGGHLSTSALLSMEAATLPDLLDSSRDVCP